MGLIIIFGDFKMDLNKVFKKALHCFSCSNLCYILLSNEVRQVYYKYGNCSWQHIAVSIISFIICLAVTMAVIIIDEDE